MKKMILILFIAISSLPVFSQAVVEAAITNARNDKGVCRACIFKSADAYRNNKPEQCVQLAVRNRGAVARFSVPAGTYAIFVFHDANNNGKMDTNWLGIPSESYGASKNNLPFAAAPSFDGNKFSIQQNTSLKISIKLRNL